MGGPGKPILRDRLLVAVCAVAIAALMMGCERKRPDQQPPQPQAVKPASCESKASNRIYLIDVASELISFDPKRLSTNPFEVIGKLTCAPEWSPYSMAIDRSGAAWVLYDNGELFKVNTADGTCAPSGFVAGSSGVQTFAMGFVVDQPGGDSEKLFIAANGPSNALHSIETSKDTLVPRHVGTIAAPAKVHPELTGTGEGKLFGFYPTAASISFVQEIGRTGANLGKRWELGTEPLGEVNAYAFAQWGGVFYIFTTLADGASSDTSLATIDRATGAYRVVLNHLPFRISGAGVSTCAPFEAPGS